MLGVESFYLLNHLATPNVFELSKLIYHIFIGRILLIVNLSFLFLFVLVFLSFLNLFLKLECKVITQTFEFSMASPNSVSLHSEFVSNHQFWKKNLSHLIFKCLCLVHCFCIQFPAGTHNSYSFWFLIKLLWVLIN